MGEPLPLAQVGGRGSAGRGSLAAENEEALFIGGEPCMAGVTVAAAAAAMAMVAGAVVAVAATAMVVAAVVAAAVVAALVAVTVAAAVVSVAVVAAVVGAAVAAATAVVEMVIWRGWRTCSIHADLPSFCTARGRRRLIWVHFDWRVSLPWFSPYLVLSPMVRAPVHAPERPVQ